MASGDQPPSEQQGERPLTLVSAAVWTLLALFLYSVTLSIAEASRQGAAYDIVSHTACRVLAYSVVFFAVLRVHEPQTSIRHVLALRPPPVLAIVLALGIGAALALPSTWLAQIVEARFPRPEPDNEIAERLFALTTVGKRVSVLLTIVALQPAFDELFFRGVLFTPLRRRRRAETVIVASAAFETLSNDPRVMLSMLVATLVFAWLRATSGSVFPGIAARMAFAGLETIPMALGKDPPKPTKVLLVASGVVALIGLVGFSFLSRRDTRILDARLQDG